MRETISQLLLQIDEAWIDHMERIKDRSKLGPDDLHLEELLFSAEAWLDRVQGSLQQNPVVTDPPPVYPAAQMRHKA